MGWRLAVDIGGTFTDVVALEEATGRMHLLKVRSTPGDPSQGFVEAIDQILQAASIPAAEVAGVFHGTTVATNAILERKYDVLGLIITRGYREALECARQTVPGEFGDITWWIKPPRVVPLELVRETSARMDVQGREMRPVKAEEITAIAREFKARKIRAIAVSLLHSYRNPAHEEEVRRLVQAAYPECRISISSEILREYREYERTNTTCLNTALMPLVSAYHEKTAAALHARGIYAPFRIMRSSGGLAQAQEISSVPIAAALSGPAAGAIAATHYAQLSGCANVITLDMGGTSTDICLVENGAPRMLTEGKVDIYDVKTPMIDLHTVGAGGGSIGWLAGGRSLKVGPQSAGSNPGPACYDRGGTEPTVTDANLVLGRILPGLAGGSLSLNLDGAVRSLEPIASALGLNLTQAAEGILRVAMENMAAGIRTVSVKRGRDPREYALVAFGGAGPLHACMLADWLGMPKVIIPPSPGIASAHGLLLTDVRVDLVHTDVQREDRLNLVQIAEELHELEERTRARLAKEGISSDRMRLMHFADLRYAGQAYEIRVPLVPGSDRHQLAEGLYKTIAAFHASHRDLYGYSYEGKEPTELVNVGVTGLGLINRPRVPEWEHDGASADRALKETTRMHVAQKQESIECPIYSRDLLLAGNVITGPAIVHQYDSTTMIEAGWRGEVDRYGNLALSRT
jgi:N-methylhydantoinase A